MSDVDVIRAALKRQPFGSDVVNYNEDAVAALDRLVAERDEWKHAAGAEADLFNLAQERTRAAEAEVARLREALAGGCNHALIVGTRRCIKCGRAIAKEDAS